ncbi:MAG: peptidyl-tRNA hydrolase Pth2 [Anaerolineae bacterium]|nr:peptidyl-tRNA hydrolase Pth2 [Anaerolineae bacterium]
MPGLKQVIVVNNALKLPKGKLAAQVAHAAVAAFLEAGEATRQQWLAEGMPKIVLKADSDQELLALQALAQAQSIPAYLVTDAGKTVLPEGTMTCLGLGPAGEAVLDELTGGLKLL